ncbi:addiction module toxin RelE [Fructilactobacillus lindneri]|uniref:Uncharacterized protein n=2 Tax=Fructilactobacillus lindneri TaxID=53444 RepID=A0A0R2JSQ8_9LACO|nr:type II toxin-antitoxin system RelE/ParE family toxin [Fructilactobacillus lindneri]ANZ57685.1 addiction module toxin RelE [Fructilactobacillus lindneri]ANZ58955.1 addiction module toxin RelE [Fructilactobacillus lindneri]KRN78421.1 hypothetical protein IV52_GL001191 [Fructilactobacillus lindneri DSM 20690 = JCM 11027]POG97980.1 addiction module toxin RelE [Fructilactobacillus lindneri]POG99034.1 addiction module toxin RelE [Fructilactobacillus lindneri]
MERKHYKLRISSVSKKQLKKMDKHQAKLILQWLLNNVDGIDNPRRIGKGLTSNQSWKWRYRIGNYRAICEIEDQYLVVTAINIGHRRTMYD